MNMRNRGLKTGDWLMLGSTEPGIVDGEIMKSCTSAHWHDELIYVNENGNAFTGTAHRPHFELLPLEDRIAKHEDQPFCIYRWVDWKDRSSSLYDDWQEDVGLLLRYTASLKIKYPVGDILRIWRNRHTRRWLRLPGLQPKSEQKLYCTESCFKIYQETGLDPFASIGKQPFPAPIHAEKLVWTGKLFALPGWDYGDLAAKIEANGTKHGYWPLDEPHAAI